MRVVIVVPVGSRRLPDADEITDGPYIMNPHASVFQNWCVKRDWYSARSSGHELARITTK